MRPSSVTPYSVTYDGNSHTATGTATGVGGVDLGSDLNLSGTTHTNAGTYGSDGWTFTRRHRQLQGRQRHGQRQHRQGRRQRHCVTRLQRCLRRPARTAPASATATGVGGVDLSAGSTLGASFTNVPGGTAHWTFTRRQLQRPERRRGHRHQQGRRHRLVNGYSGVYDGQCHGASLGHRHRRRRCGPERRARPGGTSSPTSPAARPTGPSATTQLQRPERRRGHRHQLRPVRSIVVTPYSVTYDGISTRPPAPRRASAAWTSVAT